MHGRGDAANENSVNVGMIPDAYPRCNRKRVIIGERAAVNGDIGDTYVEVDIGAQTVYYYKKGKLKYTTSCVTGMMTAGRKTPEGVSYILYKQPKATLNGQGYSSPVQYWMPFNGNVGFHSAPWRSSFGGSEYISGGSHGCVNLPVSSAAALYKLVSKGDPVVTYY